MLARIDATQLKSVKHSPIIRIERNAMLLYQSQNPRPETSANSSRNHVKAFAI